MKKYCVDTNVFLRFILRDNMLQYQKASKLLQKADDGKVNLYTPSVVIFEISFVLDRVYAFSREEIASSLGSFLGASYLEVDEKRELQKAIELYKIQNALSLVDCFLLVITTRDGAELFTFDRKLKKLS